MFLLPIKKISEQPCSIGETIRSTVLWEGIRTTRFQTINNKQDDFKGDPPIGQRMSYWSTSLDKTFKTFVLFWGAYHTVSTVPYPVEGSQDTITPEKL